MWFPTFSGGNGFCGASEFLNYHLDYNKYPKWFFQVTKNKVKLLKKIGFPIGIPLRGIVRGIVWNCEEFTGLAIAR